ncbi:transposase family protein [Kitasatospora sp. NPDC004272]
MYPRKHDTPAERDRVGDGRADYSGKHRRHGVNHQVVTGPTGKPVWIPRALPGRAHRTVKTCIRLRIPAPAGMAYTGAGGTFAVPTRSTARKESTVGQRPPNRAHARLRHPVERGVATVKRWRIFRHARCSPNWLTSAAEAVPTFELHR